MPRVVNNTVLTNFCRIGQLHLLESLFSKVYVTPEVHEEVLRGVTEGYEFMRAAAKEISPEPQAWLELVGLESLEEEQSFREFSRNLGLGEASCLALAQNRGWLVLTDDLQARRAVRAFDGQVTGSVGVLWLCVEDKLLSLEEVDALLQQMIQAGYRSPVMSLCDIPGSTDE